MNQTFRSRATCCAVGATLAMAVLVAPAHARPGAPPIFGATCPGKIDLDADGNGVVRVNGRVTPVKSVGAESYQVKSGKVTFDISGPAGNVSVIYTGPGRANGICEVRQSPAPSRAAPAASGGSKGTPSADAQACLAAVTRESNNPDVVLLDEDFSQAGTTVMVGVGAQKAPWRCTVSGGRVSDVMSLRN